MRELSLNVMDIAQNSISAKAALVTIVVEDDRKNDRLTIVIEDDGCGMTPQQVEHVIDPFYTTRTTRKVGLGVPLFKMEAEMTGGSFEIFSEPGVGTRVTAVFRPSSVDMTPLGDINSTVLLLISCNPTLDFLFTRRLCPLAEESREFTLDTRELKEVLGGEVPLDTPDVVVWIKDFLAEQTAGLFCTEANKE